tara:strand:- start:171 stop:419 length:249 start_codon:yes stop_codon:yes gene_type:complete
MKNFFKFIIIFLFFLNFKAYSHIEKKENMEMHMNYSPENYHCHKKKQLNQKSMYYYIYNQGQTLGPFSTNSSCMQLLEELWS